MNIILVVLFILLLFIPLTFSDTVGGKTLAYENRMTATFPKIFNENGKLNTNLHIDFEAWINDNVALRPNAVKANIFLRYGIFNVSPQTDIYVGKDNWMFYTSKNGVENLQKVNRPSFNEIAGYAEKCQSMTNSLLDRNIPSFFILWPGKETVYPEYFPRGIMKADEGLSNTEIIYYYIKQNTPTDITYIKDTMLDEKEYHQLYSKAADYAHWNNYGAFIGYQELMKMASKYIPNLKILTYDDVEISEVTLEPTIYGIKKTVETDYKIVPKNGYHAVESKHTLEELKTKDYWRSRNRYINTDSTLPKALIVGDSFTWMYMLPNIAESFSDLIFIHFMDIEYIKEYIDFLDPQIVMFAVRDSDIGWIKNFGSYNFTDNHVTSLIEKENVLLT